MRETAKNIYSDSTEEYRDNYDRIDWSDGPKAVEKKEEKNPNDRTDRWGFHLRKWFVK